MPHSNMNESTAVPGRPNVVLIVSDDHGYADRGATGVDPAVLTPHLDQLAENGVTCPQAYVTAPVCSPSRAGLIAGRHQGRWGGAWFGHTEFATQHRTIAEELSSLGYTCGYFGKVHYGSEDIGDRACPPHHGFDTTYYGLAGQQQGRLNYLRHSQEAVAEYGQEGSWRMGVQPMLDGDEPEELEGFLTAELGRRTRQFITDNADRPFFAMVAFNAVHNFCWQLPPEELQRRGLPSREDWHGSESDTADYLEWYEGSISPNLEHGREYYLAQLELMDREIGSISAELTRHGLAEDTLIVYLTDNGGSPCNYGDNTPLRGSKYTLWEGGIRVPFIVSWPGGGITRGASTDQVVSSLDILPTLLSAAGVTDPPTDLDGIDLLPQLRGQRTPQERTLHWDCGFQWAIRSGDWKLTHVTAGSTTAAIQSVEHADPGSGYRLHDLRHDPGEQRDLTGRHPQVARDLEAAHEAWRATTDLAGLDRTEAAHWA
ncbi:MAG TPA: sulfatase-like hydrolase/transferase [Ruania sp.]|nr:sulfatase-like hydrolase/transferase [Ruania sp.]